LLPLDWYAAHLLLVILGLYGAGTDAVKKMATTVIHIRDSNQYPGSVYIGRPGKGKDGPFGNPISKGQICSVCAKIHSDAGSTLHCYRIYFKNRIKNDNSFAHQVNELKDKTLACFCRPKNGFAGQVLCHGQIIAGWLDGVLPEEIV
jgi:hypothetical protein